MQSIYPPDEPVTRKMTPKQIEMLREIVRTSGGGVRVSYDNYRVIKGLADRHMVQGKSGSYQTAVHTRKGLEWVRANPT